MLTEAFIAATLTANAASQHLSAALKDVGVFNYEIQPQSVLRQGYKKNTTNPHCLAVSRSHIYAAQSSKAVVNVYSREKGNQESTVPFPDRILSISYVDAAEVLVLGTEDGRLLIWEVATGRISTSAASHLQAITHLQVTQNDGIILSGSQDSTVQIWSLSRLLSFEPSESSYTGGDAANAPISSFTQHRGAITALACGHSRPVTNFAISASEDSTCYIWHIDSSQVLRTVLLPSVPTCIALDPADRAAYLGHASGSVSQIDILNLSNPAGLNDDPRLPSQIAEKYQWTPSSDAGSMHCIGISYDGTFLVSGHEKGHLLRWDVAKHKVASEISRLGQPVTSVHMLRPDGLSNNQPVGFDVGEVVKPKLELGSQVENGSISIPASYKLHASLHGQQRGSDTGSAAATAMTTRGWPDSLLTAAVEALQRTGGNIYSEDSNNSSHRAESLRAENESLKTRVAAYKAAELDRMDRSLQRLSKREDVDLRRRQAYHQAIKDGMDKQAANVAMQDVEDASRDELDKIDAESDA